MAPNTNIKIDPERSIPSLLLLLMSEIIDEKICLISTEIDEIRKTIIIKFSNLAAMISIFPNFFKPMGINHIKFLLDLAIKDKIISVEKVYETGYELISVDAFKFVYEGEIQWPIKK